MTVTYSATKSFLLLLFKWKGSVWKAVGLQYLFFLLLYYALNLTYRFAMLPHQQLYFEKVVLFFQKGNGFIPVQFLLGFYVSKVISNWWDQLNCISWPDKFLIFVTANIQGNDDESRKIRRTVARYTNLVTMLVWKEISLKIKKRFPTDRHIVSSGMMNEKELEMYNSASGKFGRWCKNEGRFSDYALHKMLKELWAFRGGSAMLTMYDWINIPLVYTQVVTLATYGYFVFSLVGRQSLRTESKATSNEVELYFPLFTTLEFLFYIGWLKVGEQLRCPFGEDDDDFDMNYILDRNVHVSTMLVDTLSTHNPTPDQDSFWDIPEPMLPHTKASYKVRDPIPPWRLGNVRVKEKEYELIPDQHQETILRRRAEARSDVIVVPMSDFPTTNRNHEQRNSLRTTDNNTNTSVFETHPAHQLNETFTTKPSTETNGHSLMHVRPRPSQLEPLVRPSVDPAMVIEGTREDGEVDELDKVNSHCDSSPKEDSKPFVAGP